eukprot:6181206-Pleurochrysis_carterae.AAC.1
MPSRGYSYWRRNLNGAANHVSYRVTAPCGGLATLGGLCLPPCETHTARSAPTRPSPSTIVVMAAGAPCAAVRADASACDDGRRLELGSRPHPMHARAVPLRMHHIGARPQEFVTDT